METKFKFGIHTLVFYGLDTLKLVVENTGGFVDKIYLSHSKKPWSIYNKAATTLYESKVDSSILNDFPYREKIVWLEGEWKSEEEQRNHSLEQARKDGIDYLIVQDADEFYMPMAFQENLRMIEQNPQFPVYKCPWTVFWKTLEYVIQVREYEGVHGVTVTACPNFAVNVNYPNIRFSNRRLTNQMDKAFMLPGLCLHLAWVLSDNEVLQKIQTWGHSHQFNHEKWYRHKWLAWRPKTRCIGHITRANYLKAIPFKGILPKELINFSKRNQETKLLGFFEMLDSLRLDLTSLVEVKLKEFKRTYDNFREG